MFDRFQLEVQLVIRHVRQDDLSRLEWHGLISPYRELLHRAYLRAEAGEVAYLVADLKGFPVGQVQVDLTKRQDQNIAVIWALRVLPALQNLGIGTRLMRAAGKLIQERGYAFAELGVAKDNPQARRLYERLGYQVVGDNFERWSYKTPEGEVRHVEEAEWIMHKPLVR